MAEVLEIKIKLRIKNGKLKICNGGLPILVPSTRPNPHYPDMEPESSIITWRLRGSFYNQGWRFLNAKDLTITPNPANPGTTIADVANAFRNITIQANGQEISVEDLNAHGGGQKSFLYTLVATNPGTGLTADTDPGIENMGNDVVLGLPKPPRRPKKKKAVKSSKASLSRAAQVKAKKSRTKARPKKRHS
ncbi:MAG: hypothetical protein JNM81_09380 [Rhodospirillaceae bacterium]|nr:hypothetical protein [Rhodospirillaceae bacterium]